MKICRFNFKIDKQTCRPFYLSLSIVYEFENSKILKLRNYENPNPKTSKI